MREGLDLNPKMVEGKYLIRYYKKTDSDKVADFFERTRFISTKGLDCSLKDFIIWKYEKNRSCKGTKVLVCFKNNQIVATCGFETRWLYIKEKRIFSWWEMDLVRDIKICNNPRGKLIGFEIFKRSLLEGLRLSDKALAVTFPNEAGRNIFLKAGWIDTNILYSFVKIINFKKFLSRKRFIEQFRDKSKINIYDIILKRKKGVSQRKHSLQVNYSFREINKFDKTIDILWQNLKNKFPFIAQRDKNYLNWRYIECPSKKYYCYLGKRDSKLIGYLVTKIEEDEGLMYGYIVEIFTDPQNNKVIKAFISQAEEFLRQKGVDLIVTAFSHYKFKQALIEEGFFQANKIDFFIFPQYFKNKRLLKNLLEYRNEWFITRGDMDGDAE